MNNNTENNIDFKQLTTKEQIATLEKTYITISQNIFKDRSQEILSGKIELMDISYNLTSDNQVIYDIKIMDNTTQEEKHEYYNKDLEEIDINPEKIEAYKLLGADTKEMEDEFSKLQALDKNEDKVSLSVSIVS